MPARVRVLRTFFSEISVVLTFADVVRLDAVTEFDGLVDAGGGTGGDGGAEDALAGGDLDLDGGVTTRIEDLTRVHLGDRHFQKIGKWEKAKKNWGLGGTCIYISIVYV